MSQIKIEQVSDHETALDQTIQVTPKSQLKRDDTLDQSSKLIVRELVDLEILYFLSLGPKSGYELKKNLMKCFRLNLSYGTLYPHLHALEKSDLICGSWKMQDENQPLRKRMYGLTELGTQRLQESIRALSKVALTLQFNSVNLDLNPKVAEDETTKKIIDTARELFSVQGYTSVVGAKIKGSSGTDHATDVAATKNSGKERILIKLSTDGSIGDILRTFVMSGDLKATETIIISTAPISEEAQRLAKSFEITTYSCKDATEVASKLTPVLVEKRLNTQIETQIPA
jgi:DNA-binding PadR family transcriptional regulator